MKIKKMLSLTFLSMLISTQVISADWKETPTVPNDTKTFDPLFNQVVIDNQGNATALWEDIDSSFEAPQGRISAATLKAGATKWQLTSHLPNYPKEIIGGVQSDDERQVATLVLSKEGKAACSYSYILAKYNGHTYIASSFLNSGSQVWDTPKIISDITNFKDTTSGNVWIAYDNNSRLYAVWSDNSAKQAKINFAYIEANGTAWSTPVTISTGPTANLYNAIPVLAINPLQERIVAIWRVSKTAEDNNAQLYGAYFSLKTQQWSTPALLSTPGVNLANKQYQVSQVTSGSINYAVAGFIEQNTDTNFTQNSMYAILDNSGKWTPHLTLNKNSPSSRDVSIAIDNDFQTTFLFDSTGSDGFSKIYASLLPLNGKLSKPQLISASDSNSLSPKVVIDPIGKSIGIWTTQLASTNNAVFSSELPKGGKWTKPFKISNEDRNQSANRDISLAVNLLGTNIAIWADKNTNTSTNISVINGAIKVNNLPLPPTCIKGKQGKNKFLLQQERVRFNKIKWCASPSANVVSYNLYRNGKLIKNVKADQSLDYVDKNIEKDAKSVYAVRAVNTAGKVGQAIYLTLP